MRFFRWRLAVMVALAVVAATALMQQRRTGSELRDEIERRREQQRERTQLSMENRRLAAAQVSATELENLRADHAAVARLRGEIETLRRRTEELARNPIAKTKAAPKEYVPSITDGPMPAKMWKNAGTATPVAAMETVLWAAAGGDVDLLASILAFDAGARAKAEALLAGLSPETRAQYSSPEKLIAFLTAKDVPLMNARIQDAKFKDETGQRLVAQFSDGAGKPRMVMFALRQDGENWKLVVPQDAVEKYAAMLSGQGAPAAAAR